MSEYYKNYILTIAANMAFGDKEGFLNTRDTSNTIIRLPFDDGTLSGNLYIRKPLQTLLSLQLNSPLTQRAWTL